MAFDFDGRLERSDFQGLFGLPAGAGREAARAGVQAAGASLLGIDQPRGLQVIDSDGDGPGMGPWILAAAALVAVALAVRK